MYEAPAAIPKPTAPPKAAIRMPAMDGPIIRPACQGMEPSAIAFDRRARSTSCGISDSRLGSSNARKRVAQHGQHQQMLASATPEHGQDEGGGQGRAR